MNGASEQGGKISTLLKGKVAAVAEYVPSAQDALARAAAMREAARDRLPQLPAVLSAAAEARERLPSRDDIAAKTDEAKQRLVETGSRLWSAVKKQ
jgi:hypothetical protein